jgi:hypothetical protein
MNNIDHSKMKGVADEAHWNEFALASGGQLVAPLVKSTGVKNADYMFPATQVIADLKVLETEFVRRPGMLEKVNGILNKSMTTDQSLRSLQSELIAILRKPLQRIINTANRQIKETRRELGLSSWSGLIICVNDGFRGVPPWLARGQRWLRIFEQGAKWNCGLTAGMFCLRIRSDHDETSPPEPHAGLQGESGLGCLEERSNDGAVG